MLVQVTYMVAIFVGSLLGRVPDLRPIVWPIAVYVWHLLILPPALAVIFILASWRFVNASIKRWRGANQPVPLPVDPPTTRPTRRQIMAGIGAMVPPLATLGVTARACSEINGFRIRRVELVLPTLPPDLDGVTIAHLADLHIGKFLPATMPQRIADATNALDVDLVAFAGDLLDISAPRVSDGIDFIRRLRPRHGIVMIEGNHDVMSNAERFEGEILSAGLPLLLDGSASFALAGRTSAIQFLGITWGQFKGGREIGRHGKEAFQRFRMHGDAATAASIETVAAQRLPAAFPILLAHHPHAFDKAAAMGFPLILSGHTHGGQIMLTDRLVPAPCGFATGAACIAKTNRNCSSPTASATGSP